MDDQTTALIGSLQQALIPQLFQQQPKQTWVQKYLSPALGTLSEVAASLHPTRGAELQEAVSRQNFLRQKQASPLGKLKEQMGFLKMLQDYNKPVAGAAGDPYASMMMPILSTLLGNISNKFGNTTTPTPAPQVSPQPNMNTMPNSNIPPLLQAPQYAPKVRVF